MGKAVLGLFALVVAIACDCVIYEAAADETPLVHHARKPYQARVGPPCAYHRCGPPVGCPDGTCYSLYGAYGPYGGPLYWSRYTYGGWPYRW
jgi:hypothetical protein